MLKRSAALLLILFLSLTGCCQREKTEGEGKAAATEWRIHDPDRPQPPVVDPGPAGKPVPAPSDAVILFDGRDLSGWTDSKGQPAAWKVENGYMEVVKKTGSLHTVERFGDCQLHLEWAAPLPPSGEGQERGNSGVFLMGKYEVQILDCYQNRTYADGMTAAIYGQYPPLVNACRPPGEWQTYDIVFRRPRFDREGSLVQPARMTIFHNGVLVHENVELLGPTAHKVRLPYKPHPDRLPLSLQDHGSPVRFRNIWIRDLEEKSDPSLTEILARNIEAGGGKERLNRIRCFSFKTDSKTYYFSTDGRMKITEGEEPIITEAVVVDRKSVRRYRLLTPSSKRKERCASQVFPPTIPNSPFLRL
ncbi:MAG: DUF1080 domain-containing protein [Candidatus Aminicenantales bacterium]